MLALFYKSKIQVVLLFESDSLLMSEATMRAVEGTHLGLSCNIMVNRAKNQTNRECKTPMNEEVLRAAGTQLAAKYIRLRKAIVL